MLNLHGWILSYNIFSPFKFNIHVDMTFEQVRFDVSIDSKKLDILSPFAKSEVLKQEKCQTTHFQGTNSNLKMWFFCTRNFVIQGVFLS